MKRGTKIGWLLVAFSLILSVWVIVSQKSDASTTTSEGFVISDDGTVLEGYTGAGSEWDYHNQCGSVPREGNYSGDDAG